VKWRPLIKLPRMLKMQLHGIIVIYCSGILINSEGVVNLDLSQLKIGTGPELARKKLKKDGLDILRMCSTRIEPQEKILRKMKKVSDILDVKEDLFWEEEIATVLSGSKNNKAPDADTVVNDFRKYGGYEVRNKLLKILNMIFEKANIPSDFWKTLIKSCTGKAIRMSVLIKEVLALSNLARARVTKFLLLG
jgi:hypothetical protein